MKQMVKIARPTDDYDPNWTLYYEQNPHIKFRSVGAEGDDNQEGGDSGGNQGGQESGGNQSADVEGLKRTNAALKDEKRKVQEEKQALSEQVNSLQALLDGLGGNEGIERLQGVQKQLENDETAKLIAEGKVDEVIDRRTKSMRDDHNAAMSAKDKRIAELEAEVAKGSERFQRVVLDNDVRSAAAEVKLLDSAVEDALLVARQEFKFDNERERFVRHDSDGNTIVYGKDGSSPQTVAEFLSSLQETKRHWWAPSQGSGAQGSGGGNSTKEVKGFEGIDVTDPVAFKKRREELGMKKL